MAIGRREISGGTSRIDWLWGLVLVAAVVVLLPQGNDPTWSVALIVAGALIAWMAFIAIVRLGRRGAWRR